jgi:hypothetical protein
VPSQIVVGVESNHLYGRIFDAARSSVCSLAPKIATIFPQLIAGDCASELFGQPPPAEHSSTLMPPSLNFPPSRRIGHWRSILPAMRKRQVSALGSSFSAAR